MKKERKEREGRTQETRTVEEKGIGKNLGLADIAKRTTDESTNSTSQSIAM